MISRLGKKQDILIGIRPLQEAIESGKEIDKVLVRKGLQGEHFREAMKMIRERSIPYQLVPPEKLDQITRANHQGIIAYLSAVEYQDAQEIITMLFEKGESPALVMCDEVTDVRNFGAICRSAESLGFHAVIIPAKGNARINEDAIKSSAGAIMNISICRETNLVGTCRLLKDNGIRLIAATEKAARSLTETTITGPVCIIMGSEERGIRPDILKIADELVRIPLQGKTSSLNVSVAAAIMMYEVVRQRK